MYSFAGARLLPPFPANGGNSRKGNLCVYAGSMDTENVDAIIYSGISIFAFILNIILV